MKLKKLILMGVIIHFNLLAFGQQIFNPSYLPYPSKYYQEVGQSHDAYLQANLDKVIAKNPLWRQLVLKKKMAVGLVDLQDMQHIRYASVNGKNMVYAASLPKIAILLSAIEAIEEGCLEYSPKLKKDLRLMIAKSNNAASTRMIEALGYDKIAQTMTSERYKLYDKNDGGGLWVGKKYAKAGRKNPDPIKGLSHAANVEQVARFYTMLAYGKLVNEYWSKEMMSYLIDPEINHKFVKTLNRLAPNADIYRKSGSWRQFHADSALVFGENGRRYIIVALVEDFRGGRICTKFIAQAELALGVGFKTKIPSIEATNGPVFRPVRGE